MKVAFQQLEVPEHQQRDSLFCLTPSSFLLLLFSSRKMSGIRFRRNDTVFPDFHQEQVAFRAPTSASIEWARVRQVMAFNLPLFAASPVSDLGWRWLPPLLQLPDKCVYSFLKSRLPKIGSRHLHRHTMNGTQRLGQVTRSRPLPGGFRRERRW